MIDNAAVTKALRSLGFEFKDQTDRMMIWKKRGSTTRVLVRRNQRHDPEAVRSILKQAGMSAEEIEKFISETNQTYH